MNNASESLGARGLRLKNCVTRRNLPDDDFQTNLSIAYFTWQRPKAKEKERKVPRHGKNKYRIPNHSIA